ncbi:MAG: hypothetical protein JNL32_01700 [Candidatus Kapabacteria bacterium]|nr:hypothetical protein [Candidatus Kapabacteria bacterium]
MMNYIRTWDAVRTLRLVMGLLIIIEGMSVQDWMMVFIGVVFTLMPIYNIGCCCTSGCSVPLRNANHYSEGEP